MSTKRFLVVCMVCGGMAGCGEGAGRESVSVVEQDAKKSTAAPVGLSLFFVNGAAPPLEVLGGAPRYLQEIDLVDAVSSSTDSGIQPLIESEALAGLDWSGVTQVEELWIPAEDGSFTRERYYANAKWMGKTSKFKLMAVDAQGNELGPPVFATAGKGDDWKKNDDGLVRRFVARQLAIGCASVGDCSGASFVAENLVQLRDNLHPDQGVELRPAATALRLTWTALPGRQFDVPLEWVGAGGEFAYGFDVTLEEASAPSNGQFYQPGEAVSFRVTFRDGEGNRLHPPGALPSYGDFFSGQVESGLRYLDLTVQTRLYYALKHRESNLLAVLSGPTDKLKTPSTVVDPALFFAPQVPFATAAVDGYTAVGQTIPPAGVIFGGFADPALWSAPVSDLVTFTIPDDAQPGTYVVAIKARRDYAGEALNRGATAEVQVGQAAPTCFVPKTTCGSCHSEERTSLSTILHGLGDRRSCFGCHSSLGVEFDNAIDIRVHTIHARSKRFPADINACSTCHVTPPSGPGRGILP
jgi:hypothetical protein